MSRLLHLSDVHFGGEDAAAAAAAIDFAHRFAPTVTVVSGDLTLNGLPKEFAAARAWLDRLPKPWLSTPGNHDTPYWNLPLRALTPFRRYRHAIGDPAAAAFDGDDIRVRAITTARGAQPRLDWSKGAIALAACDAAIAELKARSTTPPPVRVVTCHHPLLESLDGPVTGGVHRGEEAARRLAEGGVDLILTGHVHVPFVHALGADSRTYAVGAGTLSVRLRGSPPGFNTLEMDGDEIRVTALGWENGAFSPQRTWSLLRRKAA